MIVNFLLLGIFTVSLGDRIPIHVVSHLVSFKKNTASDYFISENNVRKRQHTYYGPSTYYGPTPFKSFLGICYEHIIQRFKFTFCPFHNFTQQDFSLPYERKDIQIGYWKEWLIEGNKFKGISFEMGDPCGSIFRSAKIWFSCADFQELVNITEPKLCYYEGTFYSPSFCGSMHVYPWLSEELRKQWDAIETAKFYDFLTEKVSYVIMGSQFSWKINVRLVYKTYKLYKYLLKNKDTFSILLVHL